MQTLLFDLGAAGHNGGNVLSASLDRSTSNDCLSVANTIFDDDLSYQNRLNVTSGRVRITDDGLKIRMRDLKELLTQTIHPQREMRTA